MYFIMKIRFNRDVRYLKRFNTKRKFMLHRYLLFLPFFWLSILVSAQTPGQSKCTAKVKLDGQWYLIDRQGNIVDTLKEVKGSSIDAMLSEAKDSPDWNYGLRAMQLVSGDGRKLGFQNAAGEWVIEPKYDLRKDKPLPEFAYWYTTVYRMGNTYLIDTLGNEIFTTSYDAGDGFWFLRDQAKIYSADSLEGLIDIKGNIILEPKYKTVSAYSQGYAAVGLSGKEYGFTNYVFLDEKGQVAFNKYFGFCYPFREGFALVEDDDLNPDFIDLNGNLLGIPKKIDFADEFRNGRALVMMDKRGKNKGINFNRENCKYNFIDTEGNFISKKHFEDASFFACGLAKVKIKGKYGFIDKDGNVVIEAKYDDAVGFTQFRLPSP